MSFRRCSVYAATILHFSALARSPCTFSAPSLCNVTLAQSQQRCRCEFVWDASGGCVVGSELTCEAAHYAHVFPSPPIPPPPPKSPPIPSSPPALWCGTPVCTDCYGPTNVAVVGSGPPPPYVAPSCPAGGLPPTQFDYAGPFHKEGAPEFQPGVVADILEPGDGPELLLDISVVDPSCQPIVNAKVLPSCSQASNSRRSLARITILVDQASARAICGVAGRLMAHISCRILW